jgi:hypothetical protein
MLVWPIDPFLDPFFCFSLLPLLHFLPVWVACCLPVLVYARTRVVGHGLSCGGCGPLHVCKLLNENVCTSLDQNPTKNHQHKLELKGQYFGLHIDQTNVLA